LRHCINGFEVVFNCFFLIGKYFLVICDLAVMIFCIWMQCLPCCH